MVLKRCLNLIFEQLPFLSLWLVCCNKFSNKLRLITWLHGWRKLYALDTFLHFPRRLCNSYPESFDFVVDRPDSRRKSGTMKCIWSLAQYWKSDRKSLGGRPRDLANQSASFVWGVTFWSGCFEKCMKWSYFRRLKFLFVVLLCSWNSLTDLVF